MGLKSFITGVGFTAVLIAVLAGSRLFRTVQTTVDVPEEEAIVFLDPLPDVPEFDVEQDEPEDQVVEELPPPPALSAPVSESFDIGAPVALARHDNALPELAAEIFHENLAPAELPQVKSTPSLKPRPQPPKVTPPPVKPKPKAFYNVGELDGKPRKIRDGVFRWPVGARGVKGQVKCILEINTNGRVRMVRVISSTDPKLVPAARRVAEGSRFTVPKKNGVPVKVQYTYTYNLRKR